MKRASLNSLSLCNSNDEEARAKLKHQNLLQEFLELQKEFVSKKKKLQTVNQKRETLLAEVRFLRRRCKYFSMIKPLEYELQQESVQSQNPYLPSETAKYYSINGVVERRPRSLPDFDTNVVHEEGGRRKVDAQNQAPLRKEKPPKNGLINNGKSVGKKKISWQDQVALKV